jgi:HPt (histidine-containing phosphotransfer) domain-containing protein
MEERKNAPLASGSAGFDRSIKGMADAPSKILDLTYLIEASDGDADFIQEIVNDYLREMGRHFQDLKTSAATHDMTLLIRSAHTIKGASANVGASRVRETASRLESQAKKGSLDGSESLIELVGQELGRVKDIVEREGIPHLLKAG